MNYSNTKFLLRTGLVTGALALTACVTTATADPSALRARQALTDLQTSPELASRAPVAIADAEKAVYVAEYPPDNASAPHLGYLAERRVEIARQQALGRLSEDQLKTLAQERDQLQLAQRTQEANIARAQAQNARGQADLARAEAERARMASQQSSQQLALAVQERERAEQQAELLRREMQALNARPTERGYVLTLGDVLFTTGQADLKPGAAANMDKLADFLTRHPDQAVVVEGHTDSVGSQSYNQSLSQRRADAVRGYLVSRGIGSSRVVAVGRGENTPVAPNDNVGGRQQNRRVEVVIQNPPQARS